MEITEFIKNKKAYKGNPIIIKRLMNKGFTQEQAEDYIKKKVMLNKSIKNKID